MSDEVGTSRAEGDWTMAIGMRQLAIHLAVRTIIVAILVISFVWVVELLVAWLMQQSGVAPIAGRIAFWPNILLSAVVGIAMAYRLCDAAGFDTWWIAYAGVIAIVVGAAIARFVVSGWLRPPTIDPGGPIFYLTVGAIITSLWWHYYWNT